MVFVLYLLFASFNIFVKEYQKTILKPIDMPRMDIYIFYAVDNFEQERYLSLALHTELFLARVDVQEYTQKKVERKEEVN